MLLSWSMQPNNHQEVIPSELHENFNSQFSPMRRAPLQEGHFDVVEEAPYRPGRLAFFLPESPHVVTPLLQGTRAVLFMWFHCKQFSAPRKYAGIHEAIAAAEEKWARKQLMRRGGGGGRGGDGGGGGVGGGDGGKGGGFGGGFAGGARQRRDKPPGQDHQQLAPQPLRQKAYTQQVAIRRKKKR